jgi:xylulokinase
MRFMGIDMGTSGCKAVIFDENWQIVSEAYREYPMHVPGPGLLELDPDLIWEGIKAVIKEINEKTDKPAGALAVSAIGDVIIPCDENGNCTRFSIVDFDPRGNEEILEFTKSFGQKKFFDINGMPPLYIGSLAKILWIKKNEPWIFEKTKRWATYEDYIVQKLGLPPVASFSEVSRTMLFDIRKREWSKEIIELIPLTEDNLPIAKPSGSIIGELPEDVRKELGFSDSVKVITGGHDMVCAAVGAGLDEENPSVAIDISGTIEGIVASLDQANTSQVMLDNLLPCYVGHSGYVTFSVNLTAGCILRWFRDYIAVDIHRGCKEKGLNFYKKIHENVKSDEPGRLFLIPHFSGSGNPFFDANAQGVLYGLSLDTKREEIARAIIEGMSFELRLHLEAYKNAGIDIKMLRAVGGGASSDVELQLKANVLGIPVMKGAVKESSAMGAAAYAAVGIGAIKNPAEAYLSIKEEELIFYPDSEAHEKFTEAFHKYKDFSYTVWDMEKRFYN